ncbi:MAG: hypothetical protein EP329_10085 [Deltaproteobacteria bacterium]|nr:MAG: hypothetical protein EP329_10085 [Deltaproteobacteria bacterium]
MPRDDLKILLLQARAPGDASRDHERECFARAAGVAETQLVPHDLTGGPPSAAAVAACDAVMVGGAGEFYVSKGDLPEHERTLDWFRELADHGPPTYASCFGFQLLVAALGGEIIYDPERLEVGSFDLALTDAGRNDPLFGGLPESFVAQLGHKDRAVRFPDGIPNLAASSLSPFQALRLPGRPLWASQFHPELRHVDNIWRYEKYLEIYGKHHDADERRAVIDAHRPSPEASTLIRRFVELVFA